MPTHEVTLLPYPTTPDTSGPPPKFHNSVNLAESIIPNQRSSCTTGTANGLIQVGWVPRPAAWFQERRTANDLFNAARGGRATVFTQVLSGMGGVGKTQLAAQFARHLADTDQLDLLVWVTAASRDAIVTAYAQAADMLGVVGAKVPPEQAAGALLG